MKSELNISSNLFLYTSFLNDIDSGLGDSFPFPTNLSEDYDSPNSLHGYWSRSVLKPLIFSINLDIVLRDDFDLENGNYTEVEHFDMIHSVWYGRCSTFVLKKPRNANENLILAFLFDG